MSKKTYTICIIKGDGIGPDVVDEALKLISALPIECEFIIGTAGYDYYTQRGISLPDETIEKCKKADAILFGAVTTPPNIPNYQSPIIRLRKSLHLFANVRPIFSLPLSGVAQNINFVIVRENTEDLYSGQEEAIEDGFMAKRIITRTASEKIIRFAFELARKQNRQRVTVIHKANVLRKTDGLFLEIAHDVAKNYQDITLEDMLVDSAAMRIIKQPEYFQIIVTTNMFGDILSDEASALVGGLGVVASANIGEKHALFEPVHGSAPKYKGKNQVNPFACFFAVCMMLEYLCEETIAQKVRDSILRGIKKGFVTPDIGGKMTTSEVTEEIITLLRGCHDTD